MYRLSKLELDVGAARHASVWRLGRRRHRFAADGVPRLYALGRREERRRAAPKPQLTVIDVPFVSLFVSTGRFQPPIWTLDSSNDSHNAWLSRTRSIVLARHRLIHSQTPTEFSTDAAPLESTTVTTRAPRGTRLGIPLRIPLIFEVVGEIALGFGRSRVFWNATDRASSVEPSIVRIGLETTKLQRTENDRVPGHAAWSGTAAQPLSLSLSCTP